MMVRSTPSIQWERANWLQSNGKEIHTLILGSSLSFWGISPSDIGSTTYNLAYNSQTPDISYHILKSNIKYMPHLKCVLLEVAYFTFFDPPLEHTIFWNDWIAATLYFNTDKHSVFSKYGFEISNPIEFRQKLLPWRKNEISESIDRQGHATYKPLSQRAQQWQASVQWIAHQHTRKDNTWVDFNIDYYSKILHFCKERRIEVAVLFPPSPSFYWENIDAEQLEQTYDIIAELQDKFKFKFLDYSHETRLNDNDFADATHLNTDVGAKHFSKILALDHPDIFK